MFKLRPGKRIKRIMLANKSKKLNAMYEDSESKALRPKIIDMTKGVDLIVNNRMSMARLGDGEFEICLGRNIDFQEQSDDLSKRLLDVLKLKREGLLIGIHDIYANLDKYVKTEGLNDSIGRDFWRFYLTSDDRRERLYSLFDMDMEYVDAYITRPYMDFEDKGFAVSHFKNMKRIWNERDIVFVEGEFSRLGVGNDLFDNAKSIKRILCPAKHAYSKYDEIIDFCKKQDKESLFIIALGPAATLLACDLHELGFQALDIGHIDIEYGWMKKNSKIKVAIENKYTSEAKDGGRDIDRVSSFKDADYESQIVVKIK